MAWDREILSLRVKCKKNEQGCDWTGLLRHYEVPYGLVACNITCLVLDQMKFCLLHRCQMESRAMSFSHVLPAKI